jgi:hypothetical protein
MPGIPYVIAKVAEFEKFEGLTETYLPNDPVVQNAITALQNSNVDLVQEAVNFGVYPNKNAAGHFANDWLDDVNGKWPTFKVKEIIRQGMLKALKEYVATGGRPIALYWVVACEQAGVAPNPRWEMSITRGKRQITVMFHTPQYAAPGPKSPSNTMWVVRPHPQPTDPIKTVPVENPS